jgi:uncharacterized protein (TIGR00369 family)
MPDTPAPERTRTIQWSDPAEQISHGRRLSGAELYEKMRRGEIPTPPFAQLIGIDVFDIGDGRARMTLAPQEFHYNPMGCVHGGILSTLLDSVMGTAIHTTLPAGQGYLTLSLNVAFLKPVFEHTGEIMAEGLVVSIARGVATAEGRITNTRGEIVATGTAVCLLAGRREVALKDAALKEDS